MVNGLSKNSVNHQVCCKFDYNLQPTIIKAIMFIKDGVRPFFFFSDTEPWVSAHTRPIYWIFFSLKCTTILKKNEAC